MEIDGVTVKLLFFAQSKELAGVRESTILLPRKISYKHLLNIISKNFNLEEIKHNILLAKNEVVCQETEDIDVKERDSIAVIPPLSGG